MISTSRQLQQEVFQTYDQRLISYCQVNKYLKRKKCCFLCIVTSCMSPTIVSIVQVKLSDRHSYKKKRSWEITELKAVDGHSESVDTLELDLHFDKLYRWIAINSRERQSFIHNLWRQTSKQIYKDAPLFKNLPTTWISCHDPIIDTESKLFALANSPIGVNDVDFNDEFQAITDQEQEDLSRLISSCEFSVRNSEAFMDVLARDLSLLDGENVYSILSSEEQVETLVSQMDEALEEAGRLEKQLTAYDEILCHVRDTMEKMEKKNAMISTANENSQLLLADLEQIVNKLNLPRKHQLVLEEADFTNAQGLKLAVEAGHALKESINAEIDPALLQMSAVQEQKRRFTKLKDKFARSICRQLNNLFIHYGNHKGEHDSSTTGGLLLPRHKSMHSELHAYTELMHWIKEMDPKAYTQLKNVYLMSLGKLYERDIKRLLDNARFNILNPNMSAPAVTFIGLERDQWIMECSERDRLNYESVLEQVLSELEPVCQDEQQFCIQFFQLDAALSSFPKSNNSNLENAVLQKKAEKQASEDVKSMMGALFGCIKTELDNLIEDIKKQDSFHCMYALVCLNQHVMTAQSSFLSNVFASELISIKRSLDQFMQMQIDSIREYKMTRRSKCGILPYVNNIEEFATNSNSLLKSDRKADLEKWYTRLMDTILEYIAIHSGEHHRTPAQVIKMENYHRLFSLLSQLKIAVLESHRKDAKQRYNDALQAYVTLYFGRPLEKLNTFFEGVQSRVANGVKASEVSYQLAFSKQELRKVIGQYPGGTVQKGLEALYKKVEKHLSEESNLIQVVWRAMQEEFIRQYKMLEDLIQQCYPGSMINLEFTMDDILRFFSDIARSH